MHTIFDELDKYETFVYANEQLFLDTFCFNASDITSVTFNSSWMKYTYIAPNGQHIANQMEIKKFIGWMDSISTKPVTFNDYWDTRIDYYFKQKPYIFDDSRCMVCLHDEALNLWNILHGDTE